MVRRRSSQFGISLFSFQDIIISVSGVLILIVLLLTLELTEQTESDAADAALQESAREIRESIDKIDTELEQLGAELDESSEFVQLATQNPEFQLKRQMEREEFETKSSQKRLKTLESTAEKIDQAEHELENQQKEFKESQQKLDEQKKQIEQLEEDLKTIGKGGASHYSTPTGLPSKTAWICDVSEKGLRIYLMDDTTQRHTIPLKKNYVVEGEAIFQQLKAWVQSSSNRPRYLLFLVRPSGADFDKFIATKGQELSIELGFDVIGEEHIILDSNGVPVE